MDSNEFRERWEPELCGLMLASFVESVNVNDFTRNGTFMKHQMKRVRDLLARMHAEMMKAQAAKEKL